MAKLEEFREVIDKLHSLIHDGEVGCFSWHAAFHERMQELFALWQRPAVTSQPVNMVCRDGAVQGFEDDDLIDYDLTDRRGDW